jgi:hypothetical protein
MYVEQKLATCEVCGQPFAVEYAYAAERVPSSSRDLIGVRTITCPDGRCGHRNPLLMLLRVHSLLVKPIPVPVAEARVRPNSFRRFRAALPPSAPVVDVPPTPAWAEVRVRMVDGLVRLGWSCARLAAYWLS